MLLSAQGIAAGGAAAWYNPAWLFLAFFYRVFLRVSQGASRLQEVLADRWAALTYGTKAFVDGLRHVVRRTIEFPFIADHQIQLALGEKRAVSNFFTDGVPAQWGPRIEHPAEFETPQQAVDEVFRQTLERAASPFDSHPPPGQRIAWVQKLNCPNAARDDDRTAWSLLADPGKHQEAFIASMNESLRADLAREAVT